jgi:hypothetical protein
MKVLNRKMLDWSGRDDPGIVDQDIDPGKMFCRSPNQRFGLFSSAQVNSYK